MKCNSDITGLFMGEVYLCPLCLYGEKKTTESRRTRRNRDYEREIFSNELFSDKAVFPPFVSINIFSFASFIYPFRRKKAIYEP